MDINQISRGLLLRRLKPLADLATRRQKRRGRTPGRPAGEGADLRPRRLDATAACFAGHGIVGGPRRRIATKAGVAPALRHRRIGGEALQEAVIEERSMPAMQDLRGPSNASCGWAIRISPESRP